jgi:hypothetical protein
MPPNATREATPPTPNTSATPADTPGTRSLLAQFDYLSTVSGGGYIGSFFTSLFVPGRLRRGTSPLQAAQDAYRTLQYEPPGRIRTGDVYSDAPGRAPWHGCARTAAISHPTGAGDNLYAAAVIVRNWMAMQYVIGSALLVLLAALALGLHKATGTWPGLWRSEMDLLHDARQAINDGDAGNLVEFLPLDAGGIHRAVLLPPGIAYWLVYPVRQSAQPVRRSTAPSCSRCCSARCSLLAGYGSRQLNRTCALPMPVS